MILRLLSSAALCLAAITLIGCATSETAHTKELLTNAGFFEVRPETDRQKELYTAAPSYKMHSVSAKGKTFYVYKDEEKGTAMVGDAIKFRQYQRLLMDESAHEDEAVMMPTPMAMGWYGAYGPFLYGPRYGAIRTLR